MKAPIIQNIQGFRVVRDDMITGGTKVRVLSKFMDSADEFIYCSPAFGYAQIALAVACKEAGKKATIFVAKRNILHPRTALALEYGAKIVQVPNGYMSVVKSWAVNYASITKGRLLPFGLDFPEFIDGLANIAAGLPIKPREVWVVAGSGVVCRGLQQAWPKAQINAVRIGSAPNIGRATLYQAPEKYEQDAKYPPPFPSCGNYDAKVWQFIKKHGSKGALFWNVA